MAIKSICFLVDTTSSPWRQTESQKAVARSHAALVFHQRRRSKQGTVLARPAKKASKCHFVWKAHDGPRSPNTIERPRKRNDMFKSRHVAVSGRQLDIDSAGSDWRNTSHGCGQKAGLQLSPPRPVIDSLPGFPYQKSSGFAGAADFCKHGKCIDSMHLEKLTFFRTSWRYYRRQLCPLVSHLRCYEYIWSGMFFHAFSGYLEMIYMFLPLKRWSGVEENQSNLAPWLVVALLCHQLTLIELLCTNARRGCAPRWGCRDASRERRLSIIL